MRWTSLTLAAIACSACVTFVGCGAFSSTPAGDAGVEGGAFADGGSLVDGAAQSDGVAPCRTFCDDFERAANDVLGPWDRMDSTAGSLELVGDPAGPGTVLAVTNKPPLNGGSSKVALYKALPAAPKRRLSFSFRVFVKGAPTPGKQLQLFYVDLPGTPKTSRVSLELKDGELRIAERTGDGPYDYPGSLGAGQLVGAGWHAIDGSVRRAGASWEAALRVDSVGGSQLALSIDSPASANIALGDHATSEAQGTMLYDDVRVDVE